MKKKDYINAILAEAKKLKKAKVECSPNCKKCLGAEARGIVDNKNDIIIPSDNFIAGMYGDMSYRYDRWMMEAIHLLEKQS